MFLSIDRGWKKTKMIRFPGAEFSARGLRFSGYRYGKPPKSGGPSSGTTDRGLKRFTVHDRGANACEMPPEPLAPGDLLQGASM